MYFKQDETRNRQSLEFLGGQKVVLSSMFHKQMSHAEAMLCNKNTEKTVERENHGLQNMCPTFQLVTKLDVAIVCIECDNTEAILFELYFFFSDCLMIFT